MIRTGVLVAINTSGDKDSQALTSPFFASFLAIASLPSLRRSTKSKGQRPSGTSRRRCLPACH